MYLCVCVCARGREHLLSHSVVSDTLQPHGLQPIRLFFPWDFPGKSTGVGCHFLLQGDLPDPGIEPASPALAGRFFITVPPGKPFNLTFFSLNLS